MDTRDNMELYELREQIALLKEKLQRQQIISERTIVEAAQKGISKLNRAGVVSMVAGLFAIVWCTSIFYRWGFSPEFVFGTAIYIGLSVMVTIYTHWRLMTVDITRGNLVEITQRLIRFRKIYCVWPFIAIPTLLVWSYFLYCDASRLQMNTESLLIGLAAGGIIGIIFGIKKNFSILRETDKVLANIKELQQHEE